MTGLVKKIDQRLDAVTARPPRAPGAFVIYLDNAEGLDRRIRAAAEKEALKHVVFGIGNVPDQYEVAKEAEVTVVIYTFGRRPDQKVTANFALRKGDLTDAKADAVVKALSAVLPK